jgi:hypothetical protein
MEKNKIEYSTKEWKLKNGTLKTEEREWWKGNYKVKTKSSFQAIHDQTTNAIKVTRQITKCTACWQNLGMDGSQPAIITISMAV